MTNANEFIIYGASDDLIEVEGAVREEWSVSGERTAGTVVIESPDGYSLEVTLEFRGNDWQFSFPEVDKAGGNWPMQFGDSPEGEKDRALYVQAPAGSTVRLGKTKFVSPTDAAAAEQRVPTVGNLNEAENADEAAVEETVVIPFAELRNLVLRALTAEEKVIWLERKKRTIADLAKAAHNWSKSKLELADKRILHIEEVLEAGQGVYDGMTDDTEFNRGYRAALYWFRSEILDDELFATKKETSDDAKDD